MISSLLIWLFYELEESNILINGEVFSLLMTIITANGFIINENNVPVINHHIDFSLVISNWKKLTFKVNVTLRS